MRGPLRLLRPAAVNLFQNLFGPSDRIAHGSDGCRDSLPAVVLGQLPGTKDGSGGASSDREGFLNS
ncbi:MAG: hypothetical protein DMG97_17870 [Acidobacteria bacterium]|nr:MAG: hypothetical protein DMG97_17870 [Acidobacteriota bacterium]